MSDIKHGKELANMDNPDKTTEISENNSVRIAINASLSGENKRQAYPIFGQITKNATIILVHMEKIKGFLFAV